MRKSKLELYAEILEVLMDGSLALDEIAYEIDVDCVTLKKRLSFLIQNDVVEERVSEEEALYAVTEKGSAVLRALNFPKYLGKIAKNIRLIDEATEIIRRLERTGLDDETEN